MATTETTRVKRLGTVRDGVIAVEVGPERVKHFFHKALLEAHSEYFKRALNSSWKEAQDRVVCLDDVDCGTFEVFVDWLYTRKLPATYEEWNEQGNWGDDSDQRYVAAQVAMIKAYAFANRMISPDLHRAMEHELIDYYIVRGYAPWYRAVIYAFAHLPPSSLVLRAIIDAHCRDFDEGFDNEEHGELQMRAQLPNAFLVGVMSRFAKIAKLDKCGCCGDKKYVVQLDRCDYHNHATEKEKKECRNSVSTKD